MPSHIYITKSIGPDQQDRLPNFFLMKRKTIYMTFIYICNVQFTTEVQQTRIWKGDLGKNHSKLIKFY